MLRPKPSLQTLDRWIFIPRLNLDSLALKLGSWVGFCILPNSQSVGSVCISVVVIVPVVSLGLLEQNVLGVDCVTGVSFPKLVDILSTVSVFSLINTVHMLVFAASYWM